MNAVNCFCSITTICYIAFIVLMVYYINTQNSTYLEVSIYSLLFGFLMWVIKKNIQKERSQSSKVHPIS